MRKKKNRTLSTSTKSSLGEPIDYQGSGGPNETVTAEFADGLKVGIWGRDNNRVFYTGKPVDTRHENRDSALSPKQRQEYQRIALLYGLGVNIDQYELSVDSAGDVVAHKVV